MSKSNPRRGAPQQLPLSSTENTMYTEALPPPMDHRGYTGVRESRGLPVSCVHDGSALFGQKALNEALVRRICRHYETAFKLLPVAEYPDLIACLESAGARCLGLLEPASNIVVNTLIVHHQRRWERRRSAAAALGDSDPTRWLDPARWSLLALVYYLRHYFRYLSWKQALGYLYLADADLVAAMGLVETDLAGGSGSRRHFTFHAPCAKRTRGALYTAALAAYHPDPGAVSCFAYQSFDAAMAGRFQPVLGKHPIDAVSLPDAAYFLTGQRDVEDDDYYKYYRSRMEKAAKKEEKRPPITGVYGLRRRKYGADRIVRSPPLTRVRPTEGKEEARCAYEETVRNILLDVTHICYLQAFARLAAPAVVGAMHMPIVRSGFCFGPLDDPVDNILVNAVWFKTAFPSQSPPADNKQLICSERLAVLCARSLDAAIAYLRTRFGTVSRHDATLLLHRAGGCNVARACELAALAGHAPCSDRAVAIRAAVEATGHPEGPRMANFIRVLSPEAKARVLASLQRPRPLISIDDLDDIARVFDLDFHFPLDEGLLPDEKPADHVLSTDARRLLELEAEIYDDKQRCIRRNLDAIRSKEKEVLCVFGVTKSLGKVDYEFFHVNFLARDAKEAPWDLFFAEIWVTYTRQWHGECHCCQERSMHLYPYEEEGPNKSDFQPLLWSEELELETSMSRIQGTDLSALAMSAGRCSCCEHNGLKVFHPNYEKLYSGIYAIVHADGHAIVHDDGQCGDEENLKSDYVYFNDQTDIGLIKRLNAMVHGTPS